MKKRLLALVCAAVLLCALVLPGALAASDTVYLLAANDKFCDLPGGLLPESVNGTIYIPYSTFDKFYTGTDLGVYYGLDTTKGTILTLYALSGHLTFTVSMGLCEDNKGNQMDFHALKRNGAIYVPAAAVCEFFGLQYSYLPTPDRGTLIRIANHNVSLSDSVFLSVSKLGMSTRYNNILKSREPQPTPTPAPVPTPTSAPTPPVGPVPTPAPGVTTKEDVRLYLAVDASEAGPDLLTYLGSARVLLLFTPDSLPAQSALVRQGVAAGHSVGLMVDGTVEEALAQLDRGNDLLTHIARVRTRIVAAPYTLTSALDQAGWSCWRANVSGATSTTLLQNLAQRRSPARMTLPSAPGTVSRIMSQVRADRYTLRQPLETDL